MANLLQRLRERHEQKEYDKPKYSIKRLYVGEISKLKRKEPYFVFGFGGYEYHTKSIKAFGIFYKIGENKYIHIKSGQKLTIPENAIVGDYCVRNAKSFFETYVAQIREDGYTKNTKLSKKYLDELETDQNVEWAEGPIPVHNLFGA